MKTCTKCGRSKPLIEGFHVCTRNPDGRQHWCKECQSEWRRVSREKDPDRQRAHARRWYRENKARHQANGRAAHLRRKFGISIAEYDALLAAQDGACAICGTQAASDLNLAVDHCHRTGAIRGILCGLCNRLIGQANDDPAHLERAAAYLRASSPLAVTP